MESNGHARFNLNRKYGQETAALYERTYAHYLSFIEWRHNMVRWHSPAAKSAFPVFTVSWTRSMRRHNAPFHAAFWHPLRHVLASSTPRAGIFYVISRCVLASSTPRAGIFPDTLAGAHARTRRRRCNSAFPLSTSALLSTPLSPLPHPLPLPRSGRPSVILPMSHELEGRMDHMYIGRKVFRGELDNRIQEFVPLPIT